MAFTSILAGGGVDVLALVVIVALAVLELAALVARTLEVVVVLVVVGGGGGGQAEPSPPVTLKSASAPPADALAPVSSAGRAAGRDSAIPREAGTADNQVKLAVCPERAGRKRAVAALARGFPAADARGVSEAARAVAGKESDFAAVEVADGDIEPAAAEGADRKRFAGLFDIRMAVGSQVLDRRFKLAGALVEEHRKALFIPTPSFGFDLVRRGHEHVVAAAAAQIDGGDLAGAGNLIDDRRPQAPAFVDKRLHAVAGRAAAAAGANAFAGDDQIALARAAQIGDGHPGGATERSVGQRQRLHELEGRLPFRAFAFVFVDVDVRRGLLGGVLGCRNGDVGAPAVGEVADR
ncbi:MAG TPA: hypothetical protein VKU89_00835 [Solirubrobacteraceae bacterium]|nr:hypothetical protein [Solirubrobacteraceae bacterium]